MTNSSLLGLLGVLLLIVSVSMFLLVYVNEWGAAWCRRKKKRDCTWCNGTGIGDRPYLMGDGKSVLLPYICPRCEGKGKE